MGFSSVASDLRLPMRSKGGLKLRRLPSEGSLERETGGGDNVNVGVGIWKA
jgi:hypothetical protein